MRGIDYGNGKANVDLETGIRYGWISWRDLDPDVASEIDMLARDAWTESWVQDKAIEAASGILEESRSFARSNTDLVAAIVDAIREHVEIPDITALSGTGVTLDGLTVVTLDDGIFVVASLFIAWDGAFCSPCAPGAGDLRTCETRHIPVKARPLAGLVPGESDPVDVCYDVPRDWISNNSSEG